MLKKAEIKIIRDIFEEIKGHDLKLTNDAISAIVEKLGDEWDGMETSEQLALFEKAEEAMKGIAVADPSITGIADKFDKQFNDEVELCVESVVKNKTSTVDMLGQFKRLFTKDQMAAMPYPGSDADDVKGTNYRPDIVERPAVAGGKIRTVFTNDLVQATAMGKAYQADIDDATKEADVAGAVPRFKGKGKQALRDIINTATMKRNAMRSLFRRSIQLFHKLDAIDGMPLVKWDWIAGGSDGCPLMPKTHKGTDFIKITRSPKPLWLTPIIDGVPSHGNAREFSVSQVIAFNPAKALAMPEGGTLANLIDSAKGEPETPETLGEKMSTEAFDTTLVVFNAKLSNTEERAAFRKRAVEPNNEDLREAGCALYLNLKGFYEANKKWYEERINGPEEVRKTA